MVLSTPPAGTIPQTVVTQANMYYTSAGGAVPASGTVTASGPWKIERQDLTIDYWRVPGFTMSGVEIGLSSMNETFSCYGTYLVAKITATHSITKSYANFSSISYTQPQKFKWHAVSSDLGGRSYGSARQPLMNTSSLGCMGSIVSDKPFYQRQYWSSAVDEESTSKITGADFALESSALENDCMNRSFAYDQTKGVTYDKFAIHPGYEGNPLVMWKPQASFGARDYYLGGGYAYEKEDFIKLLSYIDSKGADVTNSILYEIPPRVEHGKPMKSLGIRAYDVNKHDYS